MNRSLWTRAVTQRRAPAWPCPACRKGTLTLVPKSLVHKETVESSRAHGREAWDPDWITYTFTAWVRCGHSTCGQEFVVSGVGGIEPEYDADEGMTWEPYFAPRFCWPTLDIFDVPAKCPDEVKAQLRAGFTLFWSDPAATASRVRIALERLMDHVGVPKRRRDKTARRWPEAVGGLGPVQRRVLRGVERVRGRSRGSGAQGAAAVHHRR